MYSQGVGYGKGGCTTDTTAEQRRRSRLGVVEGGRRQRNREREFERLYRENFKAVYNYVYSRVLDRAFAEDVTSEAFIKAAKAFDRFDPERAQFSTWVITIARNCAISYMRKHGKEFSATDAAIDPDLQATQDQYPSLERDDVQTAEALLATISEEDRELVRLKYYEGMQNKEIAELTGLNASTIGTRVHRAVATMRKAAEANGL